MKIENEKGAQNIHIFPVSPFRFSPAEWQPCAGLPPLPQQAERHLNKALHAAGATCNSTKRSARVIGSCRSCNPTKTARRRTQRAPRDQHDARKAATIVAAAGCTGPPLCASKMQPPVRCCTTLCLTDMCRTTHMANQLRTQASHDK